MLGILSKKYQTAGARLRAIREAIPLTRQEFCDRHGFSLSTLRALESSALGVTPKHAYKFVKAFEKEKIICTEEWLLEGEGIFPTESAPEGINHKVISPKDFYKPKDAIEKEIEFFRKNNPNSLVIQVTDNAMLPLYRTKDYVGGMKVNLPIDKHHYGNPYLVILQDNTQLIRILYPGPQEDLFNLCCLPLADLKKTPFLVNVSIKEIYQIVWHRKEP